MCDANNVESKMIRVNPFAGQERGADVNDRQVTRVESIEGRVYNQKADVWHIHHYVNLSGSCCITHGSASALCDDLNGWMGWCGRRLKRERIYVHIQLVHFFVQQKLIPL